MINFESMVFDTIIARTLLYDPKIEIKPAHLANGLFRAVCDGKYTNARNQHEVLYPKGFPKINDSFLKEKKNALVREMIHELLAADRTMFRNVNQSSYSLSHVSHITNDNHDRGAGEWLYAILAHETVDGPSPALGLLHNLLTQDDRRRNDELSVLTLPLVKPEDVMAYQYPSKISAVPPSSLQVDATGAFCDPLINAIRTGFDRLIAHEATTGQYGGKLDTLRRLVTWGCFATYLHLANSGVEDRTQRIPMLLNIVRTPLPTLQQAGIQSYQWVNRSIDRFFRREIHALVEQWAATGENGAWQTHADIERQIEMMTWKKATGGMRQERQRQASHTPRCLNFYRTYYSDTVSYTPRIAFANALADMLDVVFSASPSAVARGLGVRIGLLSASRRKTQKLYTPQPDLLEVLVRASIPPQRQWPLSELAHYWTDTYGLLFGALGDENSRMDIWDISAVDGAELDANAAALANLLELSGYARRYADGVVLVSVKE